MKVGPRYKICRRLGSSVFEKCQTQRFMLSEERKGKLKGKRGRGGLSEYGKQLLQKQRVRFLYGIPERQFYRYVSEATKKQGTDSAVALLERLESRLDNVVYRMGLATTRRGARQLVSHGHIVVNSKKLTVPSHEVRTGDTVSVREGSKIKKPFVSLAERMKDFTLPAWLTFNEGTFTGSLKRKPTPEGTEVLADLSGVLEFYSR